jgi:hypothetical protein
MRIILSSIIILLLVLVACSKEDSTSALKAENMDNAIRKDTAIIPLNDLKTGTFRGYMGGLYPYGTNEPSGQYAADLFDESSSIIPIDKLGNPSTSGKIVFISLGASVGGHMMKALITKTENNPLTNPNLFLINCNQGAGFASLNSIMNPNDTYWARVNNTIINKTSYKQVQIIYLETDDSSRVSWPNKPIMVKNDIDSSLRVFKAKFPNLKLVYVLGRTRTFGNLQFYNREPGPYYFGWGCKWAIEDQINGMQGTAYKGANAVAPMLTWGFYEWADSIPRKTDGFSWRSSQTADGLHASTVGQDTLTTRFQKFLLSDRYASIWYARH